MAARNSGRGTTVPAVDPKPKRPKVDRGEEFEQIARQAFKLTVDEWCKENLEEMPPKDVRGGVVDNLAAFWTSALETMIDSATDSYLSTVIPGDDDDDDDDDESGEGSAEGSAEGDVIIEAEFEEAPKVKPRR